MIITKSPFRISFFGGSSDYRNFYEKHGSLLIGTTINKHVYASLRFKQKIFTDKSIINYSKREEVENVNQIDHPLIRELLKLYNINFSFDLTTFSDIPQRTGLGGSSSFAVAILLAIHKKLKIPFDQKKLALDAIKVEREILNEPGGIQDQIWASYGGFNSIEIKTDGDFTIRPLPISKNFIEEFEKSLVLIYTNQQRNSNKIAKEHEKYDKSKILDIAKEGYKSFCNENIEEIGNLLKQSWIEKQKISNDISTDNINSITKTLDSIDGVYGFKLLGSGNGGFIVVLCNEYGKEKLNSIFKNQILPIKLTNNGVECILEEEE